MILIFYRFDFEIYYYLKIIYGYFWSWFFYILLAVYEMHMS